MLMQAVSAVGLVYHEQPTLNLVPALFRLPGLSLPATPAPEFPVMMYG